MTKALELINNDFIRTSEERHISYVQTIWKTTKKGDIYLDAYKDGIH